MGQDQVSGGVSVLCRLAAPVILLYGNLPKFGNKVKISNKVQFGDRFKNWCNVWSVKGVTVCQHRSRIPDGPAPVMDSGGVLKPSKDVVLKRLFNQQLALIEG